MPQSLYFYRTTHPFSNFHPSVFTEDGLTYQWAEQYLMVRKARLFGDGERLAAILAARTPAECKALGRRVTPYDDALWQRERYAVALDMLRLKFGQTARLRAFLLQTGDAELVEAAPPTASGVSASANRRRKPTATPGVRTCWAGR